MKVWLLAATSCLIASGAEKEFEAVSIGVAPERDPDYYKQQPDQRNDPKVHITAGMVSLPYENMAMLLHRAFDLPVPQVISPDWTRTQHVHYTILAKAPEGATEQDVPEMLRSMLAKRFGMAYHRESRQTQALALTIARGGVKATLYEDRGVNLKATPKVRRSYKREPEGGYSTTRSLALPPDWRLGWAIRPT